MTCFLTLFPLCWNAILQKGLFLLIIVTPTIILHYTLIFLMALTMAWFDYCQFLFTRIKEYESWHTAFLAAFPEPGKCLAHCRCFLWARHYAGEETEDSRGLLRISYNYGGQSWGSWGRTQMLCSSASSSHQKLCCRWGVHSVPQLFKHRSRFMKPVSQLF